MPVSFSTETSAGACGARAGTPAAVRVRNLTVRWTVATIKFAEQEFESPGRGTGASFGRSKGFLDAAFGLARNDSQATDSYATIEVAEQGFD